MIGKIRVREVPPEEWLDCEVCGRHPFDCDCPACPECWESGNPACYIPGKHGLVRKEPAEKPALDRDDLEWSSGPAAPH